MSRSRLLSALLVLLGIVLGACSAAEQDQVAQTLERAAKAAKGLGMQMTMTGTVRVEGISQSLRSRATTAPDGRHARIVTHVGAMSMRQWFDVDKVSQSMGIDTSMTEMQSVDPRRAAEMLSDVTDVRSVGRGTLGGVPVTRYSATVDVEEMAKALSEDGDLKGLGNSSPTARCSWRSRSTAATGSAASA